MHTLTINIDDIHEPPWQVETHIVYIMNTTYPTLEICMCVVFPCAIALVIGLLALFHWKGWSWKMLTVKSGIPKR